MKANVLSDQSCRGRDRAVTPWQVGPDDSGEWHGFRALVAMEHDPKRESETCDPKVALRTPALAACAVAGALGDARAHFGLSLPHVVRLLREQDEDQTRHRHEDTMHGAAEQGERLRDGIARGDGSFSVCEPIDRTTRT